MTVDPRTRLILKQTHRETLPFNQPTQNQHTSLEEYQMTRNPRGICVIINIEHIQDKKPRYGTNKDAEDLKNTFEKLAFIVQLHDDLSDDLSDTGIMQTLNDVAQIDHTNYDCFVCCILTHGDMGYLTGSNGNDIPIKDLTSIFLASRCRSLAGKPKLFFFQACRGYDKMGGTMIETDDITQKRVETDGGQYYVSDEADFLVGHSTSPGFPAFRNTHDGSLYIRKLVQMLNELSDSQDLLSIVIKVNHEVEREDTDMEGSTYKQMPKPVVSLRKKLYFRPFVQENLS